MQKHKLLKNTTFLGAINLKKKYEYKYKILLISEIGLQHHLGHKNVNDRI